MRPPEAAPVRWADLLVTPLGKYDKLRIACYECKYDKERKVGVSMA